MMQIPRKNNPYELPVCKYRGTWKTTEGGNEREYRRICLHPEMLEQHGHHYCKAWLIEGVCPMLENWMKQMEYRSRNK